MAKKKRAVKNDKNPSILNRRASFDYALDQKFSGGIALTGPEVKSIRLGRANLRGAYIQILDGELWLINATISPVAGNAAYLDEVTQTRNRKLLVKKRELEGLIKAKQQGMSIIPLSLSTGTRFIKLHFALGTGKKHYDKRNIIKKRDTERIELRSILK